MNSVVPSAASLQDWYIKTSGPVILYCASDK